jgi:hypothetical protein
MGNGPSGYDTGKVDANGRVYVGPEYSEQTIAYHILSDPEESVPVYFIRHGTMEGKKFGASLDGLRNLCGDKRIAIDWDADGRLDHGYYQEQGGDNAVKDIKAMQTLDRGFARVVAIYPELYGNGDREKFAIIGDITTDTHLERVGYDRQNGRKDNVKFLTLKLANCIEVTPASAPDLYDAMPLVKRHTIRPSYKHADLVHSAYADYIKR